MAQNVISTSLRRITSLILILGFLTLTACGGGSNNENDNPGADTPSQEGPRPEDIAQINNVISSVMSEQAIPGIAVGVISNSENPQFWSNAFGVKSIESSSPVTVDTVFPLASVSKPVLGTLLHIAQERGFIRLSDDIASYLAVADFQIDNPDATSMSTTNSPITFELLGRHASGIVDVEAAYQCTYHLTPLSNPPTFLVNLADLGFDCRDDAPTSLEGFLRAYLNEDGIYYGVENFSGMFGETQYSNIGAALAGFALEQGLGESVESFAQRELFAPLGMQNTAWFYENLNTEDITSTHFTINGERVVLPQYELATWPDGGLKSSANDMLNFLSAVMNSGLSTIQDVRILSEENTATMLTPMNDSNFSSFWFHGGGLRWNDVDYDPTWAVGADPGVFSILAFSPVEDVGAVILVNSDDDDFDRQALFILLAQLLAFGRNF